MDRNFLNKRQQIHTGTAATIPAVGVDGNQHWGGNLFKCRRGGDTLENLPPPLATVVHHGNTRVCCLGEGGGEMVSPGRRIDSP